MTFFCFWLYVKASSNTLQYTEEILLQTLQGELLKPVIKFLLFPLVLYSDQSKA